MQQLAKYTLMLYLGGLLSQVTDIALTQLVNY